MSKKVCFIGHRYLWDSGIKERLTRAVQNEIDLGCKEYAMGTHGEFDVLALSVCRGLREIYSDLEIEVVLTSYHKIQNKLIGVFKDEYGETEMIHQDYKILNDVKTTMYDIEDLHYKKRITESNKKMIDFCDTLICYVNTNKLNGGAKTAYNYAKKKGLKIINLY